MTISRSPDETVGLGQALLACLGEVFVSTSEKCCVKLGNLEILERKENASADEDSKRSGSSDHADEDGDYDADEDEDCDADEDWDYGVPLPKLERNNAVHEAAVEWSSKATECVRKVTSIGNPHGNRAEIEAAIEEAFHWDQKGPECSEKFSEWFKRSGMNDSEQLKFWPDKGWLPVQKTAELLNAEFRRTLQTVLEWEALASQPKNERASKQTVGGGEAQKEGRDPAESALKGILSHNPKMKAPDLCRLFDEVKLRLEPDFKREHEFIRTKDQCIAWHETWVKKSTLRRPITQWLHRRRKKLGISKRRTNLRS